MTKLMEQVKEIQRKAHVCPECRGAKKVETHPYGWLMPCDECDGTGQVDAIEIDALVKVIEVLEKGVDAEAAWLAHQNSCRTCDDREECDEGYQLWMAAIDAFRESSKMVFNGLPWEGDKNG